MSHLLTVIIKVLLFNQIDKFTQSVCQKRLSKVVISYCKYAERSVLSYSNILAHVSCVLVIFLFATSLGLCLRWLRVVDTPP